MANLLLRRPLPSSGMAPLVSATKYAGTHIIVAVEGPVEVCVHALFGLQPEHAKPVPRG